MHRVFTKIMELNIPELGGMKPSVSVGAVLLPQGIEVGFEEAYRRADECVYQSKGRTGNNVTFCPLRPQED